MHKLAALVALPTLLLLTACAKETKPPAVQPVETMGAPSTPPPAPAPLKLTAHRTEPKPSALSNGAALSCAKVTVTNQGKQSVEVNPFYFALTDTRNTKHSTGGATGLYEDGIPATTLAPGRTANGVICAKGDFTPKTVSLTTDPSTPPTRTTIT